MIGASTLGARTSTLDASALDAWLIDASTLGERASTLGAHTSTLRRFDARCTHLDARRFSARRLAHRRLDARCTRLDARCTRLDARCTRLDAQCTRLDARCMRLDDRRFGASKLGARTSTLDASALVAWCIDAQCTHHDVWVPSMRDLSGQVACQRSARRLCVVFGAGPCRICR
ncbi:UNVERIFIED_CONTAM: hypothetical protein FKN15_025209 [Acipenser sinensis]